MERTDFEYSLMTLHVLRNQIQGGNDAILFLDSVSQLKDTRINFAVAMIWQLLIVHVQNYREELEFSIPQFGADDKKDLLDGIEMCKTMLTSEWPDLKFFRNQVIAHGYRDHKKRSLFKTKKIENYKAPKTGKDITRMSAIVIALHQAIKNEYSEIFKTFDLPNEPFFDGVNKVPPL